MGYLVVMRNIYYSHHHQLLRKIMEDTRYKLQATSYKLQATSYIEMWELSNLGLRVHSGLRSQIGFRMGQKCSKRDFKFKIENLGK